MVDGVACRQRVDHSCCQLILQTLEHVGNNKAEVARRLGVDVKTIRNKLRAFEKEDAQLAKNRD